MEKLNKQNRFIIEEKIKQIVYEKLKYVHDWDMDHIDLGQRAFTDNVIEETINVIMNDSIPREPSKKSH